MMRHLWELEEPAIDVTVVGPYYNVGDAFTPRF